MGILWAAIYRNTKGSFINIWRFVCIKFFIGTALLLRLATEIMKNNNHKLAAPLITLSYGRFCLESCNSELKIC